MKYLLMATVLLLASCTTVRYHINGKDLKELNLCECPKPDNKESSILWIVE